MASKRMPVKCSQDFSTPIPYGSKYFQAIVDFYLFCCPSSGVSSRGKSFLEYGFVGSPQYAKLKRRLLESAEYLTKENYCPSKKDALPANLELAETQTLPVEYCVFLSNEERTVIGSLFKAIRNALAHGSFTVKKYNSYGRYYYFENVDGYKKAQIVLSEKTLIAWIKIIQEGNC